MVSYLFPGDSDDKESDHNVGDSGSIPGLGRFHGEGKGYPLQYSGLENSMDYIVHGVTKSHTTKRLSLSHLICPSSLPVFFELLTQNFISYMRICLRHLLNSYNRK